MLAAAALADREKYWTEQETRFRGDGHKMKAFVRFREMSRPPDDPVASFEPGRCIADRVTPASLAASTFGEGLADARVIGHRRSAR